MNQQSKKVEWLVPLFISTVLFAMQAMADEEISINCSEPKGTTEFKYCAGEAYRYADEDLNDTWKTFTSGLDPAFKKSLTEAQRAWITFRDRHCEAETFQSLGGTAYTAYYDNCLERMTRQRTEELRTLLEPN